MWEKQAKPAETTARSDSELLARVRQRDRRAFTDLYRRYQPRLFVYLQKFLRDSGIVEEAVDDVLYVVWKDARKFRGTSKVSSWIFGIAYRKALSASRRQRRYQSRLDSRADPEAVAGRRSDDPDWIARGLAELSDDHRHVVLLSYYAGFSYREIARIVDCPENTVKTRMYHARRRLRVILTRLEGGDAESERDHA